MSYVGYDHTQRRPHDSNQTMRPSEHTRIEDMTAKSHMNQAALRLKARYDLSSTADVLRAERQLADIAFAEYLQRKPLPQLPVGLPRKSLRHAFSFSAAERNIARESVLATSTDDGPLGCQTSRSNIATPVPKPPWEFREENSTSSREVPLRPSPLHIRHRKDRSSDGENPPANEEISTNPQTSPVQRSARPTTSLKSDASVHGKTIGRGWSHPFTTQGAVSDRLSRLGCIGDNLWKTTRRLSGSLKGRADIAIMARSQRRSHVAQQSLPGTVCSRDEDQCTRLERERERSPQRSTPVQLRNRPYRGQSDEIPVEVEARDVISSGKAGVRTSISSPAVHDSHISGPRFSASESALTLASANSDDTTTDVQTRPSKFTRVRKAALALSQAVGGFKMRKDHQLADSDFVFGAYQPIPAANLFSCVRCKRYALDVGKNELCDACFEIVIQPGRWF